MRAGPAGRRLAAAAGLALALAGCASVDGEQARLCRSALPALVPEGRLTILSEETDPLAPSGIRIAYRIRDAAVARTGLLRCGFGGGRLAEGRLDLAAVELDGRRLGEANLLILKRFWLGDREAMAEGEARLDRPAAEPLLPVPVGASSGYLLQQLVNGIPIGAVYGLIALAYALVYGLIGRINLAFGESAVFGAYATVSTLAVASLTAGAAGGVVAAALLALAAGALQAGLVGWLSGRLVFRPLSGAAHRPFLIATIGLAIALSETMRLIAGSRERWIQPLLNEPVLVASGAFPVTVTRMQVLETVAAAVVLGAVTWLMRGTAFGTRWRASADDPLMARLLGVDPAAVAGVTFVLASALVGTAGALTALHYGQASYAAGLMIGLKALVAALLGGIGSLPGAALGGLVIGLGETLWSAYLPADQRDIAVLSVLVAILVLKPDGLFGRARSDRDSNDARWSRLG